jgi:putative nucleotidyltransferase with HDIG domain
VKTISHAIIVLGLQRVKAVTLTRVMGDFVAPVLKIKALRACWRNSLAGAILAERLARPCQMDPDFAYAAGLLRDIGRLALLVKYPESYANLLAVSGEHSFDLMTTERDLFDIDHCQAGAWMIEKMPFPPELSEVVAHHHTLLGKPFRMVHVVRIADMLADTLGFAVITPVNAMGFDEVRRELPEMARSRFTSSPEELAADVDARIQAWD